MNIAVVTPEDADPAVGRALAAQIGVPHLRPDAPEIARCAAVIECRDTGWTVHATLPTGRAALALRIDKPPWNAALAPQDTPLGRAVGDAVTVCDCSAGFLRDAFRLVCKGKRVVALERDVVVHALGAYLLDQLAVRNPLWRDHITLHHRDALAPDDVRAECVVVDPMFDDDAAGKKSAVKKDVAILGALVGATPRSDDAALFSAAKQRATRRVVVKRGPKQAPIESGVSRSVRGKGFRFDVYLV